MTTYASEADFAALIGAGETLALTDLDNDGLADAGRLAAALTAAAADIDGLLGAQQSILYSKNPQLLQTACIHIARWHLSGGSVTEVDPVKERHDYYTKLLRDLADGIAGNEGNAGNAGHGGTATLVTAGRVFTRGLRDC